ncbi:MAG: ABC transporter ATP-binding protein [bacterium]|nr:ABC transporter ATP-binding protein [bacterium]
MTQNQLSILPAAGTALVQEAPIIRVRNLTKTYKLYDRHIDRLKEAVLPFKKKYHQEFHALRNVTFDVKKGEILGIVGRNGAGKSTLLQIITGVLSPTIGSAVTRGTISALLELGTGFNPELTGMENIYFNGTIQGYSQEEIDAKLDEVLAFADIGRFINQTLKTYSSGMKARLAFAVSVNIVPDILIVDEILAVGDELFRRKCFAKMQELFQTGCTVLYVSHNANFINDICTRAIFIDSGEKILDGPPKFVTMNYQKFLYSKNRQLVRKEIVELDKDETLKQDFAQPVASPDQKKPNKPAAPETKESAPVREKPKPPVKKKPGQQAYYIADFDPKSTVRFENFDVQLTDISIKTEEGKLVNHLVTGERYLYSFKVKFNIDAENVFFGFKVKTEKGLDLSAENTLSYHKLERVRIGDEFSLSWGFNCNLLLGIYYTNASVLSVMDGKHTYLNRIVDALVFKVLKGDNPTRGGYVSLDQDFVITAV